MGSCVLQAKRYFKLVLSDFVRDPETPRNSGWPTVSGQPLRCLNVSESGYGILGASWIEGISIEIGD